MRKTTGNRWMLFVISCLMSLVAGAQSVSPTASYVTTDGETIEDATSGQSAPLVAHFEANPSSVGDYTARYEWRIYRQGEQNAPIVHRSGDASEAESLDYTFNESGTFFVQLYATFTLGTDVIDYSPDGMDPPAPIQVTISESSLDFPNAFSPNNDGFNDTFKAKDGYQSIVSFQATIFSRWGQKIYSWNNPAGEWNGRWNGQRVKDGAYFLVVQARGADGRKYNIRKTINVISGYNNDSQGTTGNE